MADEKKQKGQQKPHRQAAGKKAKPSRWKPPRAATGKPARPKATNRATARLRDRYYKEVRPALMKEFGLDESDGGPQGWRRSSSTWAWAKRRRTPS